MLLNNKRYSRYFRHNAGFSLLELALIFALIGILIGGVIVGEELLRKSRLKTTVMDVEATRQAIATFKEKYNALPGDMMDAETRLANCDGTDCVNGNGDKQIGVMYGINAGTDYLVADITNLTNEPAQVWQHLLRAGVISSVSSSPPDFGFGTSHPMAPAGGGFDMAYIVQRSGMGEFTPGHWMVWRNGLNFVPGYFTTPGIHVISESEASVLDLQFDDNNARSGRIQAIPSNGNLCGDVDGGYDANNTNTDCTMLFKMD